jgi:hypothetical protein|tara:strand:+ start:4078 stop:4257 length:180 start_codon:yes stop_codon:yes gene_type:complete
MPTMSHTPAERKLWHEGKRKKHETSFSAFHRSSKSGFKGACTPRSVRNGIHYTPLKAAT